MHFVLGGMCSTAWIGYIGLLEVAEGLKQENKAEVTRTSFHFSSRGPYLVDSEGRTDK